MNIPRKAGITILVLVIVLSGIGIAGFQALSHWDPAQPHQNHAGIPEPKAYDVSAPAGSTTTVYYGQTVSFPGFSVSSSGSASNEHTSESTSGYPAPSYPSYPGTPGWTLSIAGNSVSSGGSSGSGLSYSQHYTNSQSTRRVGNTEYTDYFTTAYSTTSWTGYSMSGTSYEVTSYGSSGGSTQTWEISMGSGSESGSLDIYAPSVSISSSASTTDAGVSISLSSSVSGTTGSLSYSWSSSGGSFSSTTASSPSWSASSAGSYTISLKVTDGAGYTQGSNTITITVDSDPSVSLSSSKNPSDAGQSVTFTASASGGSGSYTNYNFYLNGNSVQSGSSNQWTEDFTSSGSNSVYVAVTDSNGGSGQSSTLSQTVNSDPSVSISSSQNPTDSGITVEFTSSVSGGTPGYSYSWSVNGNTFSTRDINVSFSSSGSYSVQLTVTDAAGYSVSKTIAETVNSNPTVSASSNVSSADVGYPVEFSSTPSGGTGSYSYSWTLNGKQISTSQDFSHSFSSSGSYTMTVTITDSVGVQSTASVTVDINPNPSVTVSSSQNPTDVGNSVTFSSSESGGTGTDTYVWYINGVQESTASSFSYSFSSEGIHYVNVTVTDSDGHSSSYSLKEVVNPDPSVVIHVLHNPTDTGIWANFSGSISGGTGPFNYSWTINGQSFSSSFVNYTFTSSGTFPVSLTVTDANGNTASASVNEVVNADPSVVIQASYTKVDQGINDTFAASITGGTSPFNYTWSLGGKIVNYSAEFHMNFSSTGTYTLNLTVVDSLGEQASSSITIEVITKPSALIEGPNKTDESTTTYWEGYGSYGTAPYNYYWFVNGVNTSAGLYLKYSFPSSGKYNISLLIDDSQGSKAYAYLNITVEPLPKIEVSESMNSTDVGVPVEFRSSIAGGSPFFNYSWSVSGYGYVGFQRSLTYIFSKPGVYNVTVSVIDGSGNGASSSVSITINPLPQVKIDAEYSNIDPNVTDNFNSNIIGGTPGFTYKWYVNGTFEGNGTSLSWEFSKAGIYPVRLVITDSQGIFDSYSTDITVGTYPNASIIASATNLDANVSDQFRASGFGGIGPYGYEWIIAGHEFNNNTVSYAFKSPGNYSVQLILSDSFGKDASSSITVQVHPDPAVSVSWSGKPLVSVPFPLKSNISGGIQPYQISWIFPSGQHETGAVITHVFSSSGPDTFEVQVTDQGGYTETRNFTIDVGLYVAVAANQTSGLGPLAVQFSSSVLGGSGYSYNWTFSPGHYSLQQNPTHTFPVGNYTVRFTVTSSNGATGSANISVQSLPPPVTFFYSTDLNISRAFHFRAIPNWDAKGPYNMSWSFPNGQTLTGMNISYKFPVYNELNTVIATFSYGDGKTWTQYLTVRMIPAVPVLAFSPPSIIPVDTMLSLNATATSPDSSTFTYSWDINGTSESGQSVLYYFQNPGNYSVSVTVTDGLGASSTVHRTIVVLPQGTNSSIAISYTRNVKGPMDYYTVKVLSSNGIIAVEAFLGTTPLNISEVNSTYTASGELAYFNLTMDQRDYSAGSYGISIVAFNNNSQSNHINADFQVTSQYSSSSFSLADVISFFGGFSNFLITILTVGGLVIAYASLRRQDNPDLIVQGLSPRGKNERIVLKGKK